MSSEYLVQKCQPTLFLFPLCNNLSLGRQLGCCMRRYHRHTPSCDVGSVNVNHLQRWDAGYRVSVHELLYSERIFKGYPVQGGVSLAVLCELILILIRADHDHNHLILAVLNKPFHLWQKGAARRTPAGRKAQQDDLPVANREGGKLGPRGIF